MSLNLSVSSIVATLAFMPLTIPTSSCAGQPNEFTFAPVTLADGILLVSVESMSMLPKSCPTTRIPAVGEVSSINQGTHADNGTQRGAAISQAPSFQRPVESSLLSSTPRPPSVVVGFKTSASLSSVPGKQIVDLSQSRPHPAVSAFPSGQQKLPNTGALQSATSRPAKGSLPSSSFGDENNKKHESRPDRKGFGEEGKPVVGERKPLSPLQRMLTDWQSIPVIDLDSAGSDDLKLDYDSTSQEDESQRYDSFLNFSILIRLFGRKSLREELAYTSLSCRSSHRAHQKLDHCTRK